MPREWQTTDSSASQRLAELHELLRRLEDKRADMQEKLQKRFGVYYCF